MKKNSFDNSLSKEEFSFVQKDAKIFDQKFQTKKIGSFKDAMIRFSRNKGSVIAFILLGLLVLFSIVVPIVSGYDVSYTDSYYVNCTPKVFEAGTGFWDGTVSEEKEETSYEYFLNYGAVVKTNSKRTYFNQDVGKDVTMYTFTRNTYVQGYKFAQVDKTELDKYIAYDKTVTSDKDKILSPLIDYSYIDDLPTGDFNKITLKSNLERDANYFYKVNEKLKPMKSDGKLQYIYKTNSDGSYDYYEQATNSDGELTNSYKIRYNYDNKYIFLNGSAPKYVLGSNSAGYDIITRLASGGRLSLILGFAVASINILLGVIYGSIEGYYGGRVDLVMERVSDILSSVPSMVVVTLMGIHLNKIFAFDGGSIIVLFIAFVSTGWIGTASTVRMQFYRYKNQEYILAARTLGAGDSRLIFHHILPNAIGPVVTSSVLMIPGVIFSESMLSYLNIIDLSSPTVTSIGTMLSEGQSVFTTYPNNIVWPALFISLLMISFNIFGNGLRDAFNPSLRGAE